MHQVLALGLLTLAVLTQWTAHAYAQSQDPTIQYLIGTPTTLMDKGVFEIQRRLQNANRDPYWVANWPKRLRTGLLGSVYVYSRRIEIHVYVYPDSIDSPKDVCVDLHRFAQKILGFQPDETGRPRYMAESLADLFGHYRYTPTGQPENLGNRLLGIVAVQANVIPNSGGKAFCHSIGGGPIIDGQISE